MKRIIPAIAIILAFSLALIVVTVMANDEISVTLNGNRIQMDTPPFVQDGRTLVPLRAIADALGIDVEWEGRLQRISYDIDIGSDILIYDLYIGEPFADVTSIAHNTITEIRLDTPPIIVNGRTFVPVRFIAESLGVEVGWDGNTRTVILTSQIGYAQFPSVPSFGQVTGVELRGTSVSLTDANAIVFEYRYSQSEALEAYHNALLERGFILNERASDMGFITTMQNNVVISERREFQRIVFTDAANTLEILVERVTLATIVRIRRI